MHGELGSTTSKIHWLYFILLARVDDCIIIIIENCYLNPSLPEFVVVVAITVVVVVTLGTDQKIVFI